MKRKKKIFFPLDQLSVYYHPTHFTTTCMPTNTVYICAAKTCQNPGQLACEGRFSLLMEVMIQCHLPYGIPSEIGLGGIFLEHPALWEA